MISQDIKNRQAKLRQIISDHSMELNGLECPFLWQLDDIFDRIDFTRYTSKDHCTFDFEDLCISEEYDAKVETLVNYSVKKIERITNQYCESGAQKALHTLASLIKKLTPFRDQEIQSLSDVPYIHALFYVAQSCEVVLYYLDDNQDKGIELKHSMIVINYPEQKGHLDGIRGKLYMLFDATEDAESYLRAAIPATNRFYEYVYDLAKTIARKRRLNSSVHVIPEEIMLFEEVAADHIFAVPQLIDSISASVKNMERKKSANFSKTKKELESCLEKAWNRKNEFGSDGLSRMAIVFVYNKQYDRAEELYKMAYDIKSNCQTNLSRYGTFLLSFKVNNNIEDVKRGLGFLAQTGHLGSFDSLLKYYFGGFGRKPQGFDPNSFSDYLEQFVVKAPKLTYKRIYAYIAYRYFITRGDFQKGIIYLKVAINIEVDDLKFQISSVFKKSDILILAREIGNVPDTTDLSYHVCFITDTKQNFYQQNAKIRLIVDEFTEWWEATRLRPMEEYEGYRRYHQMMPPCSSGASSHSESDLPQVRNYSSNVDQGSSNSNWRQ